MRPLILILAVALTVVAGFATLRLRRDAEPFELIPTSPTQRDLVPLWSVPPFTLTERSGQPLSLDDLRGKIWVADFFYTTCPGPCPMLTSRLSALQRELSSDPEVRLVSISSDPEKDTPEVLRAYAQHFDATDRWLFLTGPKAEIHRLATEGLKLAMVEDPGTREPIIHSTKLVLVDRQGQVRGVYDGVGGNDQMILQDIRRLEKEKTR